MSAPGFTPPPPTAHCLNCGDTYVTVAGICTRCGSLCLGGATSLGEAHRRYGSQVGAAVRVELPPPAAPATPSPAPAPTSAPSVTGASRKLILPNTRSTRHWMGQTNALIETFEKQVKAINRRLDGIHAETEAEIAVVRSRAATRVAALIAQRDEVRQAVASLMAIPNQVQLADEKQKALASSEKLAKVGMRRMPSPVGANGKWSKYYDACIECGTTGDPARKGTRHAAHGRCYSCNDRFIRNKPREGAAA